MELMHQSDFFEGIKQSKVKLGSFEIKIPVFYRDMMNINVYLLASLDKLKACLPSERMHPFRVTPWHGIFSVSAYEYKDSDLGPYNEVSLGIPFILDKISPVFTGIIRKVPEIPMIYILHLPVSTEIARVTGVEGANFPKFLAEISFEDESQWIKCRVDSEGKNILSLSVRKISLGSSPRQHVFPINLSQNHLLRLEFNLSECQAGFSKKQSDVLLEPGNHPVGLMLAEMNLGRVLAYQYCPSRQAVLSEICESYLV